MGAYLSQPITTKKSASGSGNGHCWGCSSMQGWRQGMEDAHLTLAQLGADDTCAKLSFYAVFDGHGGREVALFCQEHFPDEFRRQLGRRRRPSQEDDAPSGTGCTGTSSSAAAPPAMVQLEEGEEDWQMDGEGFPCSAQKNGTSSQTAQAYAPGPDVDMRARALVGAFHSIDDALRKPEAQQELLAFKGQGRKSPDTQAGEESSDGDASSPDSASASIPAPATRKGKGAAMLQSSLNADLQTAKQRGGLTREQASRLMIKMSLLKRLESADLCSRDDSSGSVCAADDVGCTAVCVVLSDTDILCANAGDSRAVLCRAGRPTALSRDHKPNDEVERKRIEYAGGSVCATKVGHGKAQRLSYRINGNGLNLSRSIGDWQYKRRDDLGPEQQVVCSTPEIHVEPRTPEDEFVVVACDGIWDVKTNEEVCRFIRDAIQRGEGLERIAEDLLDSCICPDPKASCGLGGDNMTCVVVQLQPSSTWAWTSGEVAGEADR